MISAIQYEANRIGIGKLGTFELEGSFSDLSGTRVDSRGTFPSLRRSMLVRFHLDMVVSQEYVCDDDEDRKYSRRWP